MMKKLLIFLGNILYIGMILWDIIGFLTLPALFLVIGLMNSFPWQYYAVTIGGYFALFIILEIVLHFIFKALNKKYTPLIERKLEKYFNKFSKKG
jgi:TRAP-type C4-dicarboxylate transport system permease small subunit